MRLVGRSGAVSGVDLSIDQGSITVGSDPDNAIVVDSPLVGRHHLLLRRRGADWMLEALDPDRPVFINGIKVVGRHALRVGDELEVGPAAFVVAPLSRPSGNRQSEDGSNRRVWLGGSIGMLMALLALLFVLGSGSDVSWSLQALEGAAASAASPGTTPPPASATATPHVQNTATAALTATAHLPATVTASPIPSVESSRATLEAALAAAPHLQVVRAMTAVAALAPEERERVLAELAAADTPDAWLEAVLSTPTPTPPEGRIVCGSLAADTDRYDIISHSLYTGEESRLLAYASQPAFSADGRLLAFHSWQDSALGLFAATIDGTERWLLTRDAHTEDVWPAWSPDGVTVAFASTRLGDGVSRVYTVPSQGGVATSATYGEYVDWSPDGTRLAVKSCIGGSCGIMLAQPDGSALVALTTEASDGAPAWSPKGYYIAFHSHREGRWGIYVMREDGTGLLRLTDDAADDCVPVWSPDGTYLAFRSDRGGDWAVWAIPATGGEPVWLFDAPTRSGDELVERLSWLP